MRRLLWPTLLLLAALPFLAVAGLAARSAWQSDEWGLIDKTPGPADGTCAARQLDFWVVGSNAGRLGFLWNRATGDLAEGPFIIPGWTNFYQSQPRYGSGRGVPSALAAARANSPSGADGLRRSGRASGGVGFLDFIGGLRPGRPLLVVPADSRPPAGAGGARLAPLEPAAAGARGAVRRVRVRPARLARPVPRVRGGAGGRA